MSDSDDLDQEKKATDDPSQHSGTDANGYGSSVGHSSNGHASNDHAGNGRSPVSKRNGAGKRRDGLLTTGDMARLLSNTLRTVRFYEEMGLLRPEQRTEGGHRLFPTKELVKLQLVSELRSAGLSLEEIRGLLELKQSCDNGDVAARAVTTKLDDQIGKMNERIELLTRLREELVSARRVISECHGCTDRTHFPGACGNCAVMTRQEQIPPAVSVLWRVDR